MSAPSPSRQGFTLLELVVTIGIIAALAGLLITAIAMVRQRAYRAQAAARIAQLQWALDNYSTEDRRHRFPPQTGPADFSLRWDPSGAAPGNINALLALGHDLDLSGFDRGGAAPYAMLDPWRRPYQYRVDSDLITYSTPQRPLDLPGWNSKGERPWAYLWSTGPDGSADGSGWIYTKDAR